ncbi:MAG: hypothetical protein J6C33_05555 [Lachnospiraceae bacterium]|nr:hypothetical protein [Lachnospiraceae bacterium]
MVLQTPQIIGMNAFDPSLPYELKFTYNDNQVIKNRLVISDHDTGNIIYDKIQNAMKLSHTIPENTLDAGKAYIAQVQVYDADNNSSHLSDQVLFYCYSTPTFSLSGIAKDEIIHKAILKVKLNYEQQEGEALKDYQLYLYNFDNSVHTCSDVLYPSSSMLYTFYGLKNNTSYYIRAIGHTTHGMTLDTGMLLFNVEYVMIPANIVFQVENHCKNGYITLFSGIIDIGYDIENDHYVIENGALKLWNNKLTYNKGFRIDGNFVLHLEAKLLPLNQPFLLLNDGITLSVKEICNNYYCCLDGLDISQYAELPKAKIVDGEERLLATSDGYALQIINANYEDNEFVIYEVKRINGIYGLRVYYKADVYGKYTDDIL